jgi:hypothetical protein
MWFTWPLLAFTFFCVFISTSWLQKHPKRTRGEPHSRMRALMLLLAFTGAAAAVLNLVLSLLLH